jgi:hypothetical protein
MGTPLSGSVGTPAVGCRLPEDPLGGLCLLLAKRCASCLAGLPCHQWGSDAAAQGWRVGGSEVCSRAPGRARARLLCAAPSVERPGPFSAAALNGSCARQGQVVGHGQHRLGHVDQPPVLVHGGLAQHLVRLVFAQAAVRHQQALGALDHLAFVERGAHGFELVAHGLQPVRLLLHHVEHRALQLAAVGGAGAAAWAPASSKNRAPGLRRQRVEQLLVVLQFAARLMRSCGRTARAGRRPGGPRRSSWRRCGGCSSRTRPGSLGRASSGPRRGAAARRRRSSSASMASGWLSRQSASTSSPRSR